jgi:DNA polymerase-3 subunit delta'
MIGTFLPWQEALAKHWLSRQNDMPHALLVHGLSGIGKRQFALSMAQALLCENRVPNSTDFACGTCDACHWVESGNHPDLMRVRPAALAAREGLALGISGAEASGAAGEAESTATAKKKLSEDLRVDQIRALEPWYHRATHRGRLRVVVIYPAETMNTVTANALLKALEEPPPETLFFLVTDALDRLLPTVLSRCQKLTVPFPDQAQSLRWLEQASLDRADQWLAAAGGAPLRALEMSQQQNQPCPSWAVDLMEQVIQPNAISVGQLADELAKQPAVEWLRVLQRLSLDVTLANAGLTVRYYPHLSTALQQRAKQGSLAHWSGLASWIGQQMPLATHPLNAKLFAHACLQRFCDRPL